MLHSFVSPPFSLPMAFLTFTKYTRKNPTDLFRLMIEEVQNYAIFTLDPNGIILSWNPGAEHLLGYTKKDIIGKPLSTIFPQLKGQNLHQDLAMAVENGQYEHTLEVIKKNKERIFVSCIVTALWGSDNKLEGFSKIIQDITPQKEYEKKREEFISLAGHELKNPIASIKAYLQLLELKLAKRNNTEFEPIIAKAIMQIDKLTHLIRDILDTSRISLGKLPFQDTDILFVDEFFKDIVETVQIAHPDYTLTVSKIPHIQLDQVDKERLEQVIANLLLNAIKYSPQHSTIYLCVKKIKRNILVSITDKGIGIPKKEQKRIFEKYYRGNEAKKIGNGLGLGLHLAQEIVEHYNGTISVESKKGKGTTFSVTLPYITQTI